MNGDNPTAPSAPLPTVFLSYATQDRPAALAIQDAVTALGLEVWLDQSELGGGDAWDQKIRRQIRECDYFMPLVSAQTEARAEGYFRREWRLAVERSLDMADDHLFILPVVIDGTDQASARVPEKFLAVQWLKLPGGQATPALEALCRRILAGQTAMAPSKPAPAAPRQAPGARPLPEYPAYPAPNPGDKLPYWMEVALWGARTAWARFQRFPRWVRIVAYVWLAIAMLSRCDSHTRDSDDFTPADAKKLKAIAEQYKGSSDKSDIGKLGAQIAHEIVTDTPDAASAADPLLAIPFIAPAGDAAAGKFADSAFAMTYGRIALSRHGHVGLSADALPSGTLEAALDQGRKHNARYVLSGAISSTGGSPMLEIRIASVEKGSILWSKSYPVAGSDPENIATEVDAKVPSLED
jgi:TolB-like protein